MIKTVIFDLGGVYFSDGTKRAVDAISESYGISKDKVKEVFSGNLGLEYRKGKIIANDFWSKAKEKWGIDAHSEDLA